MLSPTREPVAVQERVRQTLERGVQIDLSTEPCKRFLRRHVNSKVAVGILYVDIDGSTKMSMSLPAPKFALMLQIFSQEMSLLISEFGGYPLKYVGDAVIALFPGQHNGVQTSKSALDCAAEMQQIVRTSINPEFKSHSLPEIKIKVSLEYGELLVVLYGKSIERSHIDIVGPSISMAAKMLSLAHSDNIMMGNSIYSKLASDKSGKYRFSEVRTTPAEWSYQDEKHGGRYKLYQLE
ncbi:MAG: adenylate/guanylate cyclase domain-containing protein [Nitrososphaera sp.]